jgi:hypothetical protein
MDLFDRELFAIVTAYRAGEISRAEFWQRMERIWREECERLEQEQAKGKD